MKIKYQIIICAFISFLLIMVCSRRNETNTYSHYAISHETIETASPNNHILKSIPEYNGEPYSTINNNQPYFTDYDYTTSSFEIYSPLDDLGRCGKAFACIGKDIMPTEERQSIGQIKPSGWHTVRYEVVGQGSSGYLYNRCHLIGYQLAGENANERNLITGTRYLNMVGMLSLENKVAEYIQSTNNHVLYRVTPVFDAEDLVARGVQIEALSMEDNGAGICFNTFCYNIQPGIEIDYATGNSHVIETQAEQQEFPIVNVSEHNTIIADEVGYIGNKNTKKFHIHSCSSVSDMKETNKVSLYGMRDEIIAQGYSPCGRCLP